MICSLRLNDKHQFEVIGAEIKQVSDIKILNVFLLASRMKEVDRIFESEVLAVDGRGRA